MAITKFTTSGVYNIVKYDDFLAGNAAYDPGGYWPIASANGTGSSGTITFSSIPGTYKHLQIRAMGRTDEAATTATNIFIQLNGTTSSSYAYHRFRGDGTNVTASGGASQTFAYPTDFTAAGSTANVMGVFIADILDYTNSSTNKTLRFFGGMDQNAVATGYVNINSSLYNTTGAITSIKIYASSGNFTTSSTFELYGIKEV